MLLKVQLFTHPSSQQPRLLGKDACFVDSDSALYQLLVRHKLVDLRTGEAEARVVTLMVCVNSVPYFGKYTRISIKCFYNKCIASLVDSCSR